MFYTKLNISLCIKRCSVCFTSSCLKDSCLIYAVCVQWCPTHNVLCCVFYLFVLVLCTLCCQFLWIVHFDCLFGILQCLFMVHVIVFPHARTYACLASLWIFKNCYRMFTEGWSATSYPFQKLKSSGFLFSKCLVLPR